MYWIHFQARRRSLIRDNDHTPDRRANGRKGLSGLDHSLWNS